MEENSRVLKRFAQVEVKKIWIWSESDRSPFTTRVCFGRILKTDLYNFTIPLTLSGCMMLKNNPKLEYAHPQMWVARFSQRLGEFTSTELLTYLYVENSLKNRLGSIKIRHIANLTQIWSVGRIRHWGVGSRVYSSRDRGMLMFRYDP